MTYDHAMGLGRGAAVIGEHGEGTDHVGVVPSQVWRARPAECSTVTAGQTQTYVLTVTTVDGEIITYKYVLKK